MGAETLPIVVLMGPTASGKTALSLALAARLPVEIISVDSAQVYRGMDIGTAKPDAATRAAVPHHLIDILDPAESYSAARFAEDARRLIDAIRGRGRIPLLVGGTMLYLRALTRGLSALPSADAATRRALDAEAAALGWPAMHQRLAQIDPVTAARLHPNDRQRIQRALEIHAVSGRAASHWYAEALRADPSLQPLHRYALCPPDRAELHERIATRLKQMFADGLVEEVQALHARSDLHADLPSIRAVGYRQVWQHLDGLYTRDEALQKAVFATRQFAKRQLTWLRKEPDAQWLDPGEPGLAARLCTELAG